MNDGKNKFWLALAGMLTVQGQLALVTTIALSAMVGLRIDVPQWYTATWGIIIGYYFSGIQYRNQTQQTDNRSE